MRSRFLVVLGLILLPASAHAADQAAASACAAQLSKDGQLLYGKVAPTMTPKTDIKDALTGVARPMVMGGSMSRDNARTAAEAAGECLKFLK